MAIPSQQESGPVCCPRHLFRKGHVLGCVDQLQDSGVGRAESRQGGGPPGLCWLPSRSLLFWRFPPLLPPALPLLPQSVPMPGTTATSVCARRPLCRGGGLSSSDLTPSFLPGGGKGEASLGPEDPGGSRSLLGRMAPGKSLNLSEAQSPHQYGGDGGGHARRAAPRRTEGGPGYSPRVLP